MDSSKSTIAAPAAPAPLITTFRSVISFLASLTAYSLKNKMENKEYLKRVEELFQIVEDKLDEYEDEIDYDHTPDKLMLNFESSGKKVVINTQRAIKEIWLAGNSRAWHFQFLSDQDIWFAKAEQEEFYNCLANLLSDNLGQPVSF